MSRFALIPLLFLLLEFGAFVWNRRHPDSHTQPNRLEITYHNAVRPHTEPDDLLGYRPAAGGDATVTTWNGTRRINRATYRTDARHRRRDPSDQGEEKETAALFFGCSFTFGMGVNDDETLPHDFAAAAPAYRAYNYGYTGYGPQQTYAKLSTGIRGEIAEPRAIAVYTFIDDHVARAIGALRTHNQRREAGFAMPLYARQADDRLVRLGTYETARPFTAALYHALGWSELAYALHIEIPARPSADDFRLVTRLLEASKEKFETQFPGGKFYVMFYPGARLAAELAPQLRNRGVTPLDYSDWFGNEEGDMWIPSYGHPSAVAYRRVAARLARDVTQPEMKLTLSAGPNR